MSEQNVITEVHRERWRRARRGLHLMDLEAEGFAKGGIARFLDRPTVRMLILPGDPEAGHIEFDSEFWSWWLAERVDPVTGKATGWGSHGWPTAHAALRAADSHPQDLSRYIALYRNGGLEVGLGSDGVYHWDQKTAFRLVTIVGRVWAALDLYREVVGHRQVQGPWETTLALAQTNGAYLGDLGTGWLEPHHWENHLPPCEEPALLFRREIQDFPDTDGIQELAFSLGAQFEDAWGRRERRLLADQGQFAGQFDKATYGWR